MREFRHTCERSKCSTPAAPLRYWYGVLKLRRVALKICRARFADAPKRLRKVLKVGRKVSGERKVFSTPSKSFNNLVSIVVKPRLGVRGA